VSTLNKFFITYVYGFNQAQHRHALWSDLQSIAAHMTEAWCVLGDFNAILHTEDRMGGTDVTDSEIRDFADCVFNCELQEMRSTGAYYSWTNKTIWTIINRAFHNSHWYNSFNYTHVSYMANSLSDHTPSMWCKHPDFKNIITLGLPQHQGTAMAQLKRYQGNL